MNLVAADVSPLIISKIRADSHRLLQFRRIDLVNML